MVAACRELFGTQNIFGATANSWPSQNPILMSLIYMVLLVAIFAPISVRKYVRVSK
jgi:uncharacterized membrane protein